MSDAERPDHIDPKSNQIELHFNCKKCLVELSAKIKSKELKPCSPQDYARLTVGWTQKGVQIWCVRHQENVFHIDFRGQKVAVT